MLISQGGSEGANNLLGALCIKCFMYSTDSSTAQAGIVSIQHIKQLGFRAATCPQLLTWYCVGISLPFMALFPPTT